MPKFTQVYNQMVKENQAAFDEFREVHDRFILDRRAHSKEFNQKGSVILEIVRDYEQRLCGGMERGKFARYSDKVAEKFKERIKKDFAYFDMIGVEFL